MTGSTDGESAVATAAPPTTASEAALTRYRRTLRRQRIVYFSIVGAIVAALAVVVSVGYSHGEAANTTLHTVPSAPASLPALSTSTHPQPVWHTSDRAAIGDPRSGGTVVVYGTHTVRGVDARTGRQTWSYSRSDRTVCSVAQIAGVTIASYELAGNCDELTALDSGTGARQWTRTLDENGQPLDGRPTYQASTSTDTLLITTPSVIYAIYPGTGIDRWVYSHFGCAISHAVIGTAGALISQNCTAPRCAALNFCGPGPQLLLRNGQASASSSNRNPNLIMWNNIGDTDIPASADTVISAMNTTTRQLDILDATTGHSHGSIALTPAPSSSTQIAATSFGDDELLWLGGAAYRVPATGTSLVWGDPTAGPPTFAGSGSGTQLFEPTGSGGRVVSGRTGQVLSSFPLTSAPLSGSTVYPLGAGVLVTSGRGTAAYR